MSLVLDAPNQSGVLGSTASVDEATKRLRIVDAALRCVAKSGMRGTTVEEIASEAGVARATVYRTFAGGRDEIFAAVIETEMLRFFSSLAVDLARATTLEDTCVALCHGTSVRIMSSEALRSVVQEQPEKVLGAIAFEGLGRTLELLSDFAWPFFGQWLPEDEARRAGEFVGRVTLSYLVSPEDGVDLTVHESVEGLVAQHVVPGVLALHSTT